MKLLYLTKLLETKYWTILGIILLLGFALKITRLNVPDIQCFDEIYHAFTAERMLENDPGINNPFVEHPEGNAYEWTHPHLGKYFMALTIALFGQNGVGWRISSVIFGTLVVFLTAALALKLFKSKQVALLSALFLSLEGLTFVQSRIAMIDIHLVAFALLSFLLYWRWKEKPDDLKRLLWLGVALGLTVATKWNAIYVYLIIVVDMAIHFYRGFRLPEKNWIFWMLLASIFIPGGIYFLSYIQMFFQGYNMGDLVELQKQMWWYHINLKDVHEYSSKPLQWLLNLRPIYIFYRFEDGGRLYGYIYNLGNPIILWGGLIAAIVAIKKLKKQWSPELGFITIAYFLMWVPWLFSPRQQFFHHYLGAIPFLIILLSHALINRSKNVELKKNYLLINTVGASVLWFIVFLPHLTAIYMPKWFVDMVYFAIPSWK